jgi:hypothetical protein
MGDFSLSSPANLSSDTGTSPTLAWDGESVFEYMPIQGYVIYGTNPNPEFNPYHPIPSISDSSYQLSGLENNTTYYWWIYYDCDGGSSIASDIWSFNTGGQALQPPANPPAITYPLNLAVAVSTTPTITFDLVDGATGYDIQITSDFNFSLITSVDVTDVGADGSYVVQTPIDSNWTTYYLRIRSRNSEGVSDWSERVTFQLILGEVTGFNPVTESVLTSDGFDWSDVTNANGYDLKITEVSTNTVVVNLSMGPRWYTNMSNIKNDLRYKVEVRGVAADGNYGPWATVYYYGPRKPSPTGTPKETLLKEAELNPWKGRINKATKPGKKEKYVRKGLSKNQEQRLLYLYYKKNET